MSVFTISTISAAVNGNIVKAIKVVYEKQTGFLVLSHDSIPSRLCIAALFLNVFHYTLR